MLHCFTPLRLSKNLGIFGGTFFCGLHIRRCYLGIKLIGNYTLEQNINSADFFKKIFGDPYTTFKHKKIALFRFSKILLKPEVRHNLAELWTELGRTLNGTCAKLSVNPNSRLRLEGGAYPEGKGGGHVTLVPPGAGVVYRMPPPPIHILTSTSAF